MIKIILSCSTWEVSQKNACLRLSFSFLFQALLGDIPPVMSHHCCLLVHIVQVAEGCRGLKLPQTAPSTGLPTFPSEKKQLLYPPLAVSGRDTNSCSLCWDTPCWLWLQLWPRSPRGPSGNTQHDMRLSLSSEPSTDMTSCSTVHQHQCRAHVILLPVSERVSCQKLTPDLFELVSSSEMFTAGARHQFQLEMKWSPNCKITNWAASLRTPSALKSLLLWIWLYLCSAFLLPYLLSPSHPNPSMS